MDNSTQYFFDNLKSYTDVSIWAHPLRLFDFYTSSTIGMIVPDIETDTLKMRPTIRAFYDELCEKNPKILDLGANVGAWSFAVAKEFPLTRVTAVDVAPHNVSNLRLGLEHNKISNVEVLPVGVGGKKETKTFFQHPFNSGGCFSEPLTDFPSFQAEVVPLDDVLSHTGPVEFMKVDIEGAEYEAFESFTKWSSVWKVAVELHGEPEKKPEHEKRMEDLVALLQAKLGKENVAAISYRQSYVWGEIIPWGSYQARIEAEAAGSKAFI